MLSWTIDIYTKVNDVLVEGVLYLISYKDKGHIWVEITSPYNDITIESNIRNGGSVGFQGEWVDLNSDISGIKISTMLAYIYKQCKQFDEHKDEIGQMYLDYINSPEYEPIEIQESMKHDLYGRILELEDKMDMENPHDPSWREYDELWMKYDAVFDVPTVPFVEKIQETFNIEGSRDFIISLIRKFVDEFCDWA